VGQTLGLRQAGSAFPQGFLRPLLVGNVKENPVDIFDLAFQIAEYLTPGLNPDNPAVSVADAVFPDIGAAGFQGLDKGLLGACQVFRQNKVAPFQPAGVKFFLRLTG